MEERLHKEIEARSQTLWPALTIDVPPKPYASDPSLTGKGWKGKASFLVQCFIPARTAKEFQGPHYVSPTSAWEILVHQILAKRNLSLFPRPLWLLTNTLLEILWFLSFPLCLLRAQILHKINGLTNIPVEPANSMIGLVRNPKFWCAVSLGGKIETQK